MCLPYICQGDSFFSMLFNIIINDLAIDIQNKKIGVKVVIDQISIILYAYDIVLLAEKLNFMV